jgi:hypothetical protein
MMKQLVQQERKTFIKELNLKQELVINFGGWSLETLLHKLGYVEILTFVKIKKNKHVTNLKKVDVCKQFETMITKWKKYHLS